MIGDHGNAETRLLLAGGMTAGTHLQKQAILQAAALMIVVAGLAVNGVTVYSQSAATKVVFTVSPSSVAAGATSGVFTLALQDSDSQPVILNNPVFVKLVSDSRGKATFYKGDTGTGVLTGGCASIPITGSTITFRYKDTEPVAKRFITATPMTASNCLTTNDSLASAASILDVMVAPKSVTLTGEGLGATAGLVLWTMCRLECIDTTFATLCSATTPIANTAPCIKTWGRNGKSAVLVPPAATLGTYVEIAVNGGTGFWNATSFYYGPTLTAMSPSTGPSTEDSAGGAQVTISGMGFGPKPVVIFGDYSIDTALVDQKCSTTAAVPVTTGCWKSAGPTKVVVLSPTQAQAGGGPYAYVSLMGGGEPPFDSRFFYDTAVLSAPVKATF